MNKNKINTSIILLPLIFLLSTQIVYAQYPPFRVQTGWRKLVKATEISEAGDDFPNVYESAANRSNIDIKIVPTSSFPPWRVDVRGDVDVWDNRLEIWTHRTNDGTPFNPAATITGGTVYQQITSSDQYFFEGTGSIKNIYLQHQFRGVSVVIPAKLYRTYVVFTLIEL